MSPFLVFFAGTAHLGYRVGERTTFSVSALREHLPPDERRSLDAFGRWDRGLLSGEGLVESLNLRGAEPYRLLDCPIFMIEGMFRWGRRCTLVRNPRLGPLGFVAQVDPYTAWQQVDRFLGNDLAQQRDPPAAIDDTLRRDIHGFDDRSFKAGPGGPGRKRKRRK